MTVRSKLLIPPTALTGAGAALYTCPAGRTARITAGGIIVANVSGGTANCYLAVNVNAVSGAVLRLLNLAAGATFVHTGVLVLGPGDVLYGQASVASAMILTVSGAELAGVAP